jgi:hypothetical protein
MSSPLTSKIHIPSDNMIDTTLQYHMFQEPSSQNNE